MKAMILKGNRNIEEEPLELVEVPDPSPGARQVRIKVSCCGICHTDLHIIEGELPSKKLPVIPGHQVVGTVDVLGKGATRFRLGDRAGVGWLYSSCGGCAFCMDGNENLCARAQFTGYDVDGGYAQYICVPEDSVFPIPKGFPDLQAAPLFCAGIIGFRALRLSGIKPGQNLGLFGFGASAHLVIQVARHWDCRVYVFSRSKAHRELAKKLGAVWAGRAEDDPPERLQGAIIFAPAGRLVPEGLRVLEKGGTLILAGIYMTPIPELDYTKHLYYEKAMKSVTNFTKQDAQDFLTLAAEIPISTQAQAFGLGQANQALMLLKEGKIQGASELRI